MTETGGVGSIGVIAMHVDQSARDAQEGYRFTAISAGDLKNDLSPHEPINKAAMTRLQTEVDRLYGLFVDHVAAMRGVDAKAIRATEAGLFFGPDAVRSGLADALASPSQALSEFSAYLSVQRVQKSAARVIVHHGRRNDCHLYFKPTGDSHESRPHIEPRSTKPGGTG